MEQISFKITGITALLQNNPASMRRSGTGLSQKSIPTPEEEAESKVFKEADGQLYVPAAGFRFGIIKRACTGRRLQKRSASSVVSGALFLLSDRCPLTNGNGKPVTEYEIDCQRAVVQRQGIIRARPRIPNWSTEVQYEYDDDFLSAEIIEELQTLAGKISGLGDFRPDRGGANGRYSVEKIS
ncbi:hypothetical protein LCGC14_2377250 [marine sediment metagenome]|uniref:Uncharacterized protein n=1 Tax=marine sediment metagenome TaxID=412755 RepID=A0A0F9CPA7_9ZZZZ